MRSPGIAAAFETLSTPLVADALVRLALPVRVAPREIRPAVGVRLAGHALPARHGGSVDVFLEAFQFADAGDVLVIDNGGRTDEACIGDLVAIEASAQGVGGILLWGTHRDSAELAAIGLTVFSCGTCPNGPLRARTRDADALVHARIGWQLVESTDVVFADLDGVLFVSEQHVEDVLHVAREIADRERRQAALVRQGRSLRQQFRFADFIARRGTDSTYTFRKHLRQIGAAIEE
jgi:4-hydroxy-4-methyl-2-oxoglutarate aldolase